MIFMKSVNLLCLFCLVAAPAGAAKPVEVIIRGVRYASLEAYRAAAENKAEPMHKTVFIDDKGAKTVTLTPISEQTEKRLQKVGYEHSLSHMVVDFKQNWDDPMPKFAISPAELEERMRAVAGDRTEPVLIISDSNKLRVMALGKEKGLQ